MGGRQTGAETGQGTVMSAPEKTWGELGPAMRELSAQQQDFVRALLMQKPGYGAPTRAARQAGYGRGSKPSTLSKMAHQMTRNPRIVAAIAEEAKKIVRGIGHADAVNALLALVRNPEAKDHARAVSEILARVDPIVSKQFIDVTHRAIDPDQEALEELRAARELGATREKLIKIFGGNGLDRLEALEAADNMRRSNNAKVIDAKIVEQAPHPSPETSERCF
jgi:phage terminase small subunit